jgi:Fic family protein
LIVSDGLTLRSIRIDRMLFRIPSIDRAEEQALARIAELRTSLRHYVAEPRRWSGTLRRTALARAIQGSNSIEGYRVNLDDALAAVQGEEPMDAADETWAAVVGYRNAMTYVLQLANDPHFSLDETLLRSLHFMMTSYDLRRKPGRWRTGPIYVRDDASGETVYEGPDADDVPGLVRELVTDLNENGGGQPPILRAAMAHLNLVMIHPYSDGNGRMARGLQTLILAREGILAPQFSSVEEYLGANTEAYYAVLAEAGGGSWRPERDARAWIRFMLTAHHRQAETMLRRIRQAEALWVMLDELVARHRLPERTVAALYEAAAGRRLRRSTYLAISDPPVSDPVATRDLRALTAAGLIEARGENRGRFYVAGEELAELAARSRPVRSAASGDLFGG